MRFSTRHDGDFHIRQDRSVLERRRRAFVDLPWTQPDEVHGVDVAYVDAPGALDGAVADIALTDCVDAVLGIWVGDCAPVALSTESGRIAGVHAGWRGVEHGVLDTAVAAIRRRPDERVEAIVGPCIHACCNEFGDDDLTRLVARFGPHVEGRTLGGRPAFDLPAAIDVALSRLGVDVVDRSECTGCRADRWFSHRMRREPERQIMAVWRT